MRRQEVGIARPRRAARSAAACRAQPRAGTGRLSATTRGRSGPAPTEPQERVGETRERDSSTGEDEWRKIPDRPVHPRTSGEYSPFGLRRVQPAKGGATIVLVAPGDVQSAFAQAARRRRDRARQLVVRLAVRAGACRARAGGEGAARSGARRAGDGGARAARGDLRPPEGRRLGPARIAREPAAAGRAVPRADGDGDRGRRAGSLHLVPPRRARALPRRRRARLSTSTSTRSCAAPGARRPTASPAAWPAKGFGFGGVPARARLPRCVARPRRRRPWATRRVVRIAARGRRRRGRLCAPSRGAAGARSAPEVRGRLVGDRDVDRRAPPAACTRTLLVICTACIATRRARCRTRRTRSRPGRCRGRRAGRRPPGARFRRRAAPRRRGSAASDQRRHRSLRAARPCRRSR